ncbi:GNAT family N-acetyltransferase [Pontibacter sp. CAU 1760]
MNLYFSGSNHLNKHAMLRYLRHHQINKTAWDACVHAAAERIIYGQSWYLDAVCPRWDAVVEEQEGRYVSVFPLPLARRMGVWRVQQPLFTQQLGLFTTTESTNREVSIYLNLLPPSYRKVYLQLNTQNKLASGIPQYHGSERQTYHLSLELPYQALYQQYNSNQKRNINKAIKAGLEVHALSEVDTLIRVFRETKGVELRELRSRHYQMLQQLYLALQRRQAAGLLQAVGADGQLQAGALLVHEPGKIIFLFGASTAAGKRNGAMAFLLDACIQRYAGSACVFDFEGSMVPSVAKFYAGFGGTPVPYVSLNRQLTPWYRTWKKVNFTS